MSDTENRIPYKAFIAASARAFSVPFDSVMSKSRSTQFVRARQVAAALMRKHRPDASLPEIGRRLGGKDHTTILHAVRQTERFLKSNDDFRDRYLVAEQDALSWSPDAPKTVIFTRPPPKTPPKQESPSAVKYARPTRLPDFWGDFEPLENKLMRQSMTRSTIAMADRLEKAAAKVEASAQ